VDLLAEESFGVRTDITEDIIRAVALPTGLDGQCRDEVWSGLKLVRRRKPPDYFVLQST
jgi:hypothetical protein